MSGRRIWVAGHNGMVGSAVARCLVPNGEEASTVERAALDLPTGHADLAAAKRPDAVVPAAARVGGIYANDAYPAGFIYQNLAIGMSVIHAAHLASADRLVFLGASCIYPEFAPQPIKEAALLSGAREPTNSGTRPPRSPASALSGLAQATPPPLHFGHAMQPLRCRR